MSENTLSHQVPRFIASGCTAVLVDLAVYFLLLNVFPPEIAKGISFLSGTLVAYLLNKFWTFGKAEHQASEIFKFLLLYATTLSINIWVNHTVLDTTHNTLFSFIMATGASTVLNFIGQKFWVFRDKTPTLASST